MYYIWLGYKLFGDNKYIFLCMQLAESSIKTILIKIFEQNVDYAKVDHFSTSIFKNDDASRKIMTLSIFFYVKW